MREHMENYQGFGIGPIRPPSESESLLLRITRNCPWNQCKFCGLYKDTKFSIRPKEHVLKDIDIIKEYLDTFKVAYKKQDNKEKMINDLKKSLGENNEWAFHSALNWYRNGMKSIFLQDANSMIIKPDDMVEILLKIREEFPSVNRITSYARSHTIARISEESLERIGSAGLNRIHIGMETASDEVLKIVKKGVDKTTHIAAGQKVKNAGIELSEYYMPGLGGNEYLRESALETADALNQINPDFIRIRTLAIPNYTELYKDYEKGIFTRANDIAVAEELLMFIENLKGITSTLKSDHILNLIPEVEGNFPNDKQKMIDAIKRFLDLNEYEKTIYRIGRRIGIMNSINELSDQIFRKKVEDIITRNKVSNKNIDQIIDELMKQFV
jgi:radical SAM superfamily enzyme YgiQ (UPF0313 family)